MDEVRKLNLQLATAIGRLKPVQRQNQVLADILIDLDEAYELPESICDRIDAAFDMSKQALVIRKKAEKAKMILAKAESAMAGDVP